MLNKFLIGALVIILGIVGFNTAKQKLKQTKVIPDTSISPAPQPTKNIWGMMAGRGNLVPLEILVKEKEVGVAYQRPNDVTIEEWIESKGKCDECEKFKKSGLKVVLTVRNNGVNAKGENRIPTTPPTDLIVYQKAIREILEAYRPAILVVENEENAPPFYYDGTKKGIWDSPGDGIDTAEEYRKELDAACDVARRKEIPCANGGITSEAIATLTWYHYLEQGNTDKACSFAKRAFYTKTNPNAGTSRCLKNISQIPPEAKQFINNGLKLMNAYRDSSNSHVNFHWYIHDDGALRETIDYARSYTGKPVVVNEIGQWDWDDNPEYVQPLMQTMVDNGVAIAVWYVNTAGGTTSLIDSAGNLTPSGKEFYNFLNRG